MIIYEDAIAVYTQKWCLLGAKRAFDCILHDSILDLRFDLAPDGAETVIF